MIQMDTVSVVIPAYNSEKFIGDAIESVINQSHAVNQIIVVDDGSTDGTKDVLEKYQNQIEVVRQMNAGPSAARNTGIKRAHGEYICFLDSDDTYLPRKIERQLSVFRYLTNVGLVHTGANVVHKDGSIWYTYIPPVYYSREEQIEKLLKSNYIVSSTVMIKRNYLSQAGLFNESYRYAEDYDLWLRLLVYCNFGCVPEVHCHYRWHDRNTSTSADVSSVANIQKEAAKRFGQM